LGNLYIADSLNSRIRKVTLDGTIHTIAGNGGFGFSGDGGPATEASLWGPSAIAVDDQGNILIMDSGRVRKLTPR
jgi:sugar lactone lactonase YvrE